MQAEPKLERIGAALSDISRKRMLCALMGGRALTSKELALTAGIAPSTASGHLDILRNGGLVASLKSGRSTYHRLAGQRVAAALEGLAVLEPPGFQARRRTADRQDPGCLQARCCYDHIAGEVGVHLCTILERTGAVTIVDDMVLAGVATNLLELAAGIGARPGALLGRTCLDWSERKAHLSGRLGRTLLTHWLDRDWLRRPTQGRALDLTPAGRQALESLDVPQARDSVSV